MYHIDKFFGLTFSYLGSPWAFYPLVSLGFIVWIIIVWVGLLMLYVLIFTSESVKTDFFSIFLSAFLIILWSLMILYIFHA